MVESNLELACQAGQVTIGRGSISDNSPDLLESVASNEHNRGDMCGDFGANGIVPDLLNGFREDCQTKGAIALSPEEDCQTKGAIAQSPEEDDKTN